jgi:UDP-N-acetylglucosamine/UDP-N-acetyl-alpha-D-glucosaminouronate 4-epimerase
MRYVVTGGAGFIGSHIVEHLASTDNEIVVLDNFSTGKRENIASFADRIEILEGSVTDPATCQRAMQGADFVIHQAALPSVPRSIKDPIATHEVNATGTLNVLIAARDAGVKRVVYASSSSAYGDSPELPRRESLATAPLSPYAVAKLAGEQYCRAFALAYRLETVMLRYFNVFGPRQDPNSEYAAVVPRFFQSALANRAPTIFGDGEQTRDFTFVENVARANLLACVAPAAQCSGETFNVGAGRSISVNDLWSRICAIVGVTLPARYEAGRAGDVRHSLASTDKAAGGLGYRAAVDVDEGLRRTAAALGIRQRSIDAITAEPALVHPVVTIS